jgi:hypothetical protein
MISIRESSKSLGNGSDGEEKTVRGHNMTFTTSSARHVYQRILFLLRSMRMADNSALQSTYWKLLLEIDPTNKDDPEAEALIQKLVKLTETWQKNYPDNPHVVASFERETMEWIQGPQRRYALASG